MRYLVVSAALSGVLCVAGQAVAQTPAARPPVAAPAASTGPMDGRFLVGVIAGAGSVQNVGGLFGGEIAFQANDTLEVFGEATSIQDVVTRRRLDHAQTIANFLQTTQGKTATGAVEAPAFYGGTGVRLTLMKTGRVRPYVAFNVGAAHVAFKPKFTLAGSDVSTTLAQYGVALGSDLTGEVTKAAVGGGGGVRLLQPRWYVDGGIRVLSIRTTDQPTTVLRAAVTVGVRF